MTENLYNQIEDALKDRGDWEKKQNGAYKLRYGGIKRANKPYPNAPDMHYPLADSHIDKLKPLFVQQLYANDTLANFISTRQQPVQDTQAASEWFDYQVKQKSNFEAEIYSAIDQFLECGFINVKAYYHPGCNTLCFSVVDNMHLIVPKWTEEINNRGGYPAADWVTHVITLSEAQYRKNPNYNQDDDFIKSIKGKGSQLHTGENEKAQNRELREGLNCGRTDEEIILWEIWHYDGTGADAKMVVSTIAPVRGWEAPVRPRFGNPFDHGMYPFFRLRTEVTRKGYYTPRGVPERDAPFQGALKKMWDLSLQWPDFFSIPMFKNTSGTQIPNPGNFKPGTGQILPPGIEPIIAPPSPIDYDKHMGTTRALAEYNFGIPDFGTSEHVSGKASRGERTTATEVNAIVGISGQSNDLRARIFRMDLGEGLRMIWLVLLQYKKSELQYVLGGDLKQAPPGALHSEYIIVPNGSADSWNKGQIFQKALMKFNLLRGDPFINQGELRKMFLEADDSRDVKRLYQDPGMEAKEQAEQQAIECISMLFGWPAGVDQADDDKTHLVTMAQFIQRRLGQQEPVTPELARLTLMHGSDHTEALRAKHDPALAQITQQMAPLIQVLSAIAAQPDQPTNVVNMQPQGNAPSQPGPGIPGQPAAAPPAEPGQEEEMAVKTANMLINAAKSGIPITLGQLNTEFRKLGLPDLPMQPMPAVHSSPSKPAA